MQKLKILSHLILFFPKKHWIIIGLLIIILFSFFLMIFSAKSDSLVVDEKVHIAAGYLHTWKGDYTFNSEHPPLLNDLAGLFAKIAKPTAPAVPVDFNGGDQWEYGDMFFYQSAPFGNNNVQKVIFWARLPFILLTLGLIYLIFLWAKALFGSKAGPVAAALAAFSPNILAHGRLATTDIGVVFFFLLACWFLRKYFLKSTWANAVFLGLTVGLAILAKFSGLAILPVILAGLLFFWIQKRPKFWVALGQFFLVLTVFIILIWGVYAFSMRAEIPKLPQRYEMSEMLGRKVIVSKSAKWVLMPFDKFSRGYQILSDHNTSGHWSYLNGQVDYVGWWYYFPLVLLYKMTFSEIILLVVTIVFILRPRHQPSGEVSNSSRLRSNDNFLNSFDYFLLIFPPLLFLAISMIGRIDIGIRHILVILPFFYIFISSLVLMQNVVLRKIVLVLVALQIAVGILAFPNYIAYFNQIAGGAKGGIQHLSDSNLDWNQNMNRFGKYAREHNISKVYELCWDSASFLNQGVESEVLPNVPVNGIVVICAQQLVVPPDGFDFSWVTKYPPDAALDNGMYIWWFPKGV